MSRHIQCSKWHAAHIESKNLVNKMIKSTTIPDINSIKGTKVQNPRHIPRMTPNYTRADFGHARLAV